MRKSVAVLICFVAAFAQISHAQGPGLSLPLPSINVLDFGARADAQIYTGGCQILGTGLGTLTCAAAVFATTDVGKFIEIPGAGSTSSTAPAPLATWLATIAGVATCTSGLCTQALLGTAALHATSGVAVTWGTDNATPFQNTVNACPSPTNASIISPFTSKGCVIVVPNPGSAGTGDYMFGSGVTLPTQTSFEIRGMGNSARYQGSQQSGVRFLTAMPITILTVGQSSGLAGTANYGGFHLDDISFVDSSANGSALGGLLMFNVSEAVISYCEFENFNGQTADPANPGVFPNFLAYGMKANPIGSTNNNIVLFHDKGQNNAVFYDASLWGQDGPIVIGGDVFPVILPPSTNAGYTGPCYGYINAGPMQIYGAHFDSGANNYVSSGNACYAVKMLNSGIIHGKFESSASVHGNGILVQGGSTFQQSSLGASKTCSGSNCYVSITATGNGYTLGQVVNVTNCADATYQGHFAVTSIGSTFTYDDNKASSSSTTGCTIAGVTTSAANIEVLAANTVTAVTIQSGASNNRAVITIPTSAASATGAYMDAGTNDGIEVFVSTGNSYAFNGSTIFNGTLQVPTAAGLTTPVNGQIGYDITNNVPHMAVASADAKIATFTVTPASGDCVNWANNLTQVGASGGGCNNSMLQFFCVGGGIASGQTVTLVPGGEAATCSGATGTPVEMPISFAGTLKNLYVNVGAVPVNTVSVTVYEGGSPTSITCSIAHAGPLTCNDSSHTQGVSVTSTISVRVGTTSASETLKDIRVSLQLQ